MKVFFSDGREGKTKNFNGFSILARTTRRDADDDDGDFGLIMRETFRLCLEFSYKHRHSIHRWKEQNSHERYLFALLKYAQNRKSTRRRRARPPPSIEILHFFLYFISLALSETKTSVLWHLCCRHFVLDRRFDPKITENENSNFELMFHSILRHHLTWTRQFPPAHVTQHGNSISSAICRKNKMWKSFRPLSCVNCAEHVVSDVVKMYTLVSKLGEEKVFRIL